jgi:isopropylmalate/homocitrate/citramalate synthase
MTPLASLPRAVRVVEVGPRDGLQNEASAVPTAAKLRFIDLLARAGLRAIEVTSFVSPRAVPQLADAEAVMAGLPALGHRHVVYSALVPNLKGMERALAAGARAVAVFTGATDAFTQANIGMTIAESLAAFAPVLARARSAGIAVRGYISVCFGCPYAGAVAPAVVLDLARRLLDLGCAELSLGDTIGVATPRGVVDVAGPVLAETGPARLALHLHDTRGTALANALTALQLGVTTLDAAAGGLGGCPFAPGAAGNLATEDLLYLLDGLGIETGVSLAGVTETSRFLRGALGRPLPSRYLQALDAAAGMAVPGKS